MSNKFSSSEDWLESTCEPGLVSVIIPCHNAERFLRATLESVAAQEYRPLEVIVVDDGSTDGSRRVLDDFQNREMEGVTIKCLYQSQHGAQHARNQGCIASTGEFIQFLDADDILCPEKISEQMKVFNSHSEVDVVYGDGQYLVSHGDEERMGRIISMGDSSDITESMLLGPWACVPPFSYLNRRAAVLRCGPWDPTLKICQDWEFFLRMAIKGSIFEYKKGITGLYRKHSFTTVSEQSALLRVKTERRILAGAEDCLRKQGELNERRVYSMVQEYRRIARIVYTTDLECFNSCIDDIVRLCPNYLPKKRKARIASSIIGFRNYERLAAVISHMIKRRPETNWL